MQRSLKVMLVDDDPRLRESVGSWLAAHGHQVRSCESGQAALAALRSGAAPDLIVLDLVMPGMDGWQFRLAQKCDPMWADIPVITLASESSGDVPSVDAAAHINKPVDPSTLLSVLERVADKRAHDQELARAGELERLVSLGALLGGIAHEINNPLAFVFGSIDILQRQLVTLVNPAQGAEPFSIATAMRALERAREGAERVAAVVRSASMFVSADLTTIEAIDIHEVLESSLQVASNEIRHGAHLMRAYEDVPHVLGNPARLGQVFLNLLLNAVYAIRESGGRDHVIRVETARDERFVTISVTDSATVLEPTAAAEMFDPLQSARSVDTRLRFGLAVSRELVQSMGGRIEAEACQPRGATFRVWLPIHGRVSYPAPPPKPPMRVAAEGSTVLVVDDEPLLCELLSAMLSETYLVTAFSSPRAALAALQERDFDAVLCDVMMPELNGVELFDRAVRERPELRERFVFITGGAFTERARLFLKQTGRPVLRKPCDRAELLDVVGRIVKPPI